MVEVKDKYNIWGGRFKNQTDEIMENLNASIFFDYKLAKFDIEGSKAHTKMLAKQQILKEDEAKSILDGLDTIQSEIETGKFEPKVSLEDIHMNIEARLAELIGPVAGKLHTARSRNDQVATDFRLWLRDRIDTIVDLIYELEVALVLKSSENIHTVMPGFTHLQCAQPITFAHHLLAYVSMLDRDRARYLDTRKRLNESPLGSAALAGTSFPIDPDFTAEELSFSRAMLNSLDGVSSRDFALEFLSSTAICATHLSRLSEEIVIWTTSQFNFVKLSDKFTTGSSIMPQKRNPDAAELIRAKTGRVNGALITLLTVIKGLPLAYSKDLQEDKEPVFDAAETIEIVLKVMTGMIQDLKANVETMKKSSELGFSTATDLADFLVREYNLPFREAHKVVGELVLLAEEKSCTLKDLSLEDLKGVYKDLECAALNTLSVEGSVQSRNSKGGTSPENVKRQIQYWKETLKCA
ncbi:MAG: argininosuccinate lyase [Rhodobacteraceae bacterium]|nr:argininosuccinate lyase [Paracoccaceae bacterium]